MEVKDNTHTNGVPTAREQNTNRKTDHQQKMNLKVKEEKCQQSSKNEVQQQIRLEATKTANIKTEDHQLEKEKETISTIGIEIEDNESELLALWYGDPNKDIMSAEDWLGSVQVSISPTFYARVSC